MPTPHTDCICLPECVCVCVIRQEIEREWVSEWGTTHQKHSANWLLPLCHIGTEIFLSFLTHTPKSNYPQKNRTQQRILGEGGFKKCVCVKIIILSYSSASLISLKAGAGLIANRCCIYKIINLGCLRGSGGQHAGLCFVTCVCVCVCVYLCVTCGSSADGRWGQACLNGKTSSFSAQMVGHYHATPLINTHLHLYHSLFLSSRFLWPDPVHRFPYIHPGLFWPCLSPLCLIHIFLSLFFWLWS